ncbi:MAG TPA: hypothetical protein VFQ30_03420 [Ktedonobacteraceae bacterium]|nr:hypothetical protein [Ktedonobacteraceae bacterium]
MAKRRGRRETLVQGRLITGLVGGILLAGGLLWAVWLVLHPALRPNLSSLPIVGKVLPTSVPQMQIPPLTAEGITLGHASQTAGLSQQQALLIAATLEPDAAKKAQKTSASYVLLNYPTGKYNNHASLTDMPVWMIVYQKIPLQAADASVDPTPFPQSTQDLYLFLDANSGKEVLAIWV